LNAARGSARTVSADTAELFEKAIAGWHLTDGSYDPTVLDALPAAGYKTSLELIDGSVVTLATGPTPGCGDIGRNGLDITLPVGVGFDPGGIGKGLGGDIVARELIERGAVGVLVNLGGDVRVAGRPADGDHWMIAIEEPTVCDDRIATVALNDGAVATSTTLKRQWQSRAGTQHHLIDPATGQPHRGGPVLAAAIAGEGWWAEVQTKAMMSIDPHAVPGWAEGVVGLIVRCEGEIHRLGGFGRFER